MFQFSFYLSYRSLPHAHVWKSFMSCSVNADVIGNLCVFLCATCSIDWVHSHRSVFVRGCEWCKCSIFIENWHNLDVNWVNPAFLIKSSVKKPMQR